MSTEITLPKDVDVTKVTFAAPKSLDNGGKMVYMYHKQKPFIMQTPVMDAPYGVTKWTNDKGGDKYNIDLSFGKPDTRSKDLTDFELLMKSFDDAMIDAGISNSQAFFKKNLKTREVVEALYSPLVKHSKDKETGEITDKYPPTIRFQMPMKDGKLTCEVYNKECEKVEFDSIDMKRAKVSAIVQCNGLWVAGGKFGCTFKVLQMKVVPTASSIKGYAFVDDADDTDA